MLTRNKSMVVITPANSITQEKEDLLLEFANLIEQSLAVYNREFSDLQIIAEDKIAKKDRMSVCNGIICDAQEYLGISASVSNMPVIKEIDLSPLDQDGNSTRTKVYSGNFKLVKYCGYGEPVFDRLGNIIAEISIEKNIFFLMDVLAESVNTDILRYILDEAGLYLFQKSITGRTDSYSNASFLYKNIASKKIDEKIKAIRETVDKAAEKIELMEHKLITMIRLKDKAEVMMESEYQLRDTIAEQVKRDLDDMAKISGYKMIRFVNDKVIGVTDDIFITHNGTKYRMGRYRIEVGFDNGAVRIYSAGKNQNKGGANSNCHPHVSGANPCLGNIRGTLHQYIAKYEFSTVFDLLYQLLSNYNATSPYSNIENWPKA